MDIWKKMWVGVFFLNTVYLPVAGPKYSTKNFKAKSDPKMMNMAYLALHKAKWQPWYEWFDSVSNHACRLFYDVSRFTDRRLQVSNNETSTTTVTSQKVYKFC